jgi:uncharacterized protein YraI
MPLLLGGVAATTAAPASAGTLASYIGSNSGGANLRTCPNTGCAAIAYMPNGTGVTMLCWIDSQWVSPPASDYGSARWFRLSTPWGTGYTHSSLVEGQTAVGHC